MVFRLQEKRRFPRMELKTPVGYKIRGVSEFNKTICNDISLGGIRFVNSAFIAPGTSLKLEIKLLSRIISPIGRIAWSSVLPHSNRYHVGIEFLELDLSEKNYLCDYIKTQTMSR